MAEVYALRLRGSDDMQRIRARDGQTAQEVFDAALAARDISPDTVSSFYRAGRDIPLEGTYGGMARAGRHIPGEELIFQMRGLPDLGEDATMVHAGWFNETGRGPVIDPGALALTDRAAAALRELEDAGLSIVETLPDGRYRNMLTREGLDRPVMRLPEAKYGIPFKMVERVEIEAEPPAVNEDHPGMSGP